MFRVLVFQVFGMRPSPRTVVAGAGAGCGRVPPSTLYTRVLALKGGLCRRYPVEGSPACAVPAVASTTSP